MTTPPIVPTRDDPDFDPWLRWDALYGYLSNTKPTEEQRAALAVLMFRTKLRLTYDPAFDE